MKTLLLTLTYTVGIGELILAIYFWVTNSKSEIRKIMAGLALSTGVWAITNALTAYVQPSEFVTLMLNLLFICAITSVTLLVLLVIVFPYRTFTFDRLHAILLFIPAAFIAIILLTSSTIINGYTVSTDTAGWVVGGQLFPFYQIIVGLIYLISLSLNIYKIRKTDGRAKHNLKLFLVGAFFAAFPAIFLNIWSSFVRIEVNPLLVVLPSVIWLGITTSIITRK